ncbi:PAS domain S-box protein [Halobacteria archaeon AArc-dxtr1]|nr:PAS domain S-box protein [Halobacteria archaeon AArc-dxtr1]
MSDRPTTSDGSSGTDASAASDRSRALAELVEGSLCELDASGRFVAVDEQLLTQTGYAREDLLGERLSAVSTNASQIEHALQSEKRVETGEQPTFEISLETADGGRVPCEVRLSHLASGGAIAVVREIDDRTAIGPSRESLSAAINEADVGVFVLDDEFNVAWANEAIERYFGVDRTEIVGRDKRTLISEQIRDRFADPDRFVDNVFSTYDDNTYVEQFECRVVGADDREEHWLEHRSKPIDTGRYAGGRIELYYDITERKKTERARAESERRFRSLLDAIGEYAIVMLDREGTVVSWNEGAARINGYDTEEILGAPVSTFYTDDDREAGVPESHLAQARETGSIETESWRVRADGSTFWANVTITAIRDDGELQGYATVTRDMTERRERERQLKHERDLTERLLETAPVGIAVVDPDGTTDRVNERMVELLGDRTPDAQTTATNTGAAFDGADDVLPIEDWPAEQVFENGVSLHDHEMLAAGAAGAKRWLSINAVPIDDDEQNPTQAVVTATDITDLKALADRRKRALREREKEFTAVQMATNLLENGDRPVDDLLTEFARRLAQSFQYADHTGVRIAVDDHEVTIGGYEAIDRHITARTTTSNGTPIAVAAVVHESPLTSGEEPFLDEEQELVETFARLVKFHFEQREYIEQLREETKRLEQFAYAASHDLQEPLRMISSYLQLIETRYAETLDDEGREFLEFAVDGAERMRAMVDGLLQYSRIETQGSPLEPIDLNAVLDDVRSDLEVKIAESGAEVTADSLPTVAGDASQLRQVFQNLLENAIEYSTDEPRIHISAERDDERWMLSVSDDGIGIAPDDVERIFEVFERLHTREEYSGTGIGLALCQRIVERHGGEIWIDSEPGEGTTVSFTLPPAGDT